MSRQDLGHTVRGCQGKWIEITALVDPYRKEKCSECRAVRRLVEGEYEAEPLEEWPGPGSEVRRWTWLEKLLLLAVVLGLIVAGFAAFG